MVNRIWNPIYFIIHSYYHSSIHIDANPFIFCDDAYFIFFYPCFLFHNRRWRPLPYYCCFFIHSYFYFFCYYFCFYLKILFICCYFNFVLLFYSYCDPNYYSCCGSKIYFYFCFSNLLLIYFSIFFCVNFLISFNYHSCYCYHRYCCCWIVNSPFFYLFNNHPIYFNFVG